MRVLALLLGVSAMGLLGKPTARAKLEKVAVGFSSILKASPALEDLVAPMLKEVKAALDSKDDKVSEKVLKDEFPKWQKQMGDRQAAVSASGDSERTSLLVAVLQNKADLPMSEQLDVVQSADFAGLPCVDFIVKNHDEKTPLVNLALKFLDGDKAVPVETKAATKEAAPASLDGIVALLKKHEEKAESRLKQIEKRETDLKKAFGKLKADPQVKFLRRREERKLAKDKAIQESTEKALSSAITDIEHKDAKGLGEAKKALEASMQALEENTGEFLHFLQLDAPGFSCPYCGAQCVEKCVNTEHKSYSGCLGECLAKNPSPADA